MHLIYDRIFHRCMRKPVLRPPEVLFHNSRMIICLSLGYSPCPLPGNSSGIGIKDQLVMVKIEPLWRIKRTVQLIGVLKVFHIETWHKDRVGASDPVGLRNADDRIRNSLLSFEKEKVTASRAHGRNSKIHSSAKRSGAVKPVIAGSDMKAGDLIEFLPFVFPGRHVSLDCYAVFFCFLAGLPFQEPANYVKTPHNRC